MHQLMFVFYDSYKMLDFIAHIIATRKIIWYECTCILRRWFHCESGFNCYTVRSRRTMLSLILILQRY